MFKYSKDHFCDCMFHYGRLVECSLRLWKAGVRTPAGSGQYFAEHSGFKNESQWGHETLSPDVLMLVNLDTSEIFVTRT